MADGWAVEVTMKVMGGGESKQVYYAHIPGREEAEQAVARKIAATPDVVVRAREVVPHNAFAGMNISEGGIGQWA